VEVIVGDCRRPRYWRDGQFGSPDRCGSIEGQRPAQASAGKRQRAARGRLADTGHGLLP